MGVVYQAHDPIIGRPVAIKLVRADLLEGEDREEFLARFRLEAQAAGRCTHHNIVAIYDFSVHEGNPFLAMEYVEGTGLGDALKSAGRYGTVEALSIAGQVLDALGAAHAHGIVHRDIKPGNILLLPGSRVKVTDFGISRVNTSELTQDGRIIGTPAYMSPEQCRGETVDPRSDLFSVGAVLYELLSGARAFPGRNATEVTLMLLTAEPRDITELVPDMPPGLAATLRRALTKDREARFPSAQAMADALRAAGRGAAGRGAVSDETMLIGDRSIVRPLPGTYAGTSTFDEVTLDTIERRLARYIGPIARRLVRDAAHQTLSIESLCDNVARNIGSAAERSRFLSDALNGTASRATASGSRSSAARPVTTGGRTASQTLDSPAPISSASGARAALSSGSGNAAPLSSGSGKTASRSQAAGSPASVSSGSGSRAAISSDGGAAASVSSGSGLAGATSPGSGSLESGSPASVSSGSGSRASLSSGSGSPTPISIEQVDRAERALTRAIGPIARLLVKRALPGAASEAALWERLAGHIERQDDRQAFLRQRPGA